MSGTDATKISTKPAPSPQRPLIWRMPTTVSAKPATISTHAATSRVRLGAEGARRGEVSVLIPTTVGTVHGHVNRGGGCPRVTWGSALRDGVRGGTLVGVGAVVAHPRLGHLPRAGELLEA